MLPPSYIGPLCTYLFTRLPELPTLLLSTQPHYHRTCLLRLPTLFPMPPTYLHVHKSYTPYIRLFTITCTTLVYSHSLTFQFFVFWENPVVECEICLHVFRLHKWIFQNTTWCVVDSFICECIQKAGSTLKVIIKWRYQTKKERKKKSA